MKNLLIASTSTVYGKGYLEYLLPEMEAFFAASKDILFIPYARPSGISHDAYTKIARKAFKKIGKNVVGIHTLTNPIEAVQNATGIFTGGGNTFLLVKSLYEANLMQVLREVIFNGTPYLGTSAGSNICGVTMKTTNDMPIVYPPSFKTLGVVPFVINPHYLDPNPTSTHMGETRETRINEYLTQNTVPVVGLREGSWIEVKGDTLTLRGDLSARIFEYDKEPYEVESGSFISF